MSGISHRDYVKIGLAEETRKLIDNAIALSPALEETILTIAELCYRDGADESAEERADYAARAFTAPRERRPVLAATEPASPAVARERTTGRRARRDPGRRRPAPEPPEEERCLTCGKFHKPPEVVGANNVRFWPGHEYIIRTRVGTQKYPREWRMGYMGFGYGMEWSARGPDGTHDAPYGGTQNIGLEQIIYAEEVERDHAKRYVGRVFRG